MSELIRCKVCRKPISKDEQINCYSLCYDDFRRSKKSGSNKAFFLEFIGSITLLCGLISIIGNIIITNIRLSNPNMGIWRPLMPISIFIGSIIALLISLLLIYFGIMKKRKWKNYLK